MARPISPPTNDPAMPRNAVAKHPIGSRPGINSLAMPPTIRPIINQPIMEKSIRCSPRRSHYLEDEQVATISIQAETFVSIKDSSEQPNHPPAPVRLRNILVEVWRMTSGTFLLLESSRRSLV
jgi:hypothetical protein